ncbi:MAG TPA: GFA family protein [Shinella sp.]|jgi:hypothetical protein|uniref:GFA family protein n=1 Tax=Shinella sp. TaxID=1870904 RepID=UPI0029BD955A|nr:GFA family protein [Shinella sp.]MDX3974798.1 GFA family protein [Shinella sp.]HEV7247808.1 GFA family protein [Shinella sp.]
MRTEHGHCFCGAIAATFTGDPFWICFDHDDDCRRAIGGPMTIWIGYSHDQVTFSRGQPQTFSKTRGVVRQFCGKCGTSIAYTDEGLPGEIYVCIGFMDAPERFPPQAHGFWRQRLPFIKMDDGLARVDAYTRRRTAPLGRPDL